MIQSFPLRPGPLAPGAGVMNGWRVTSTFGARPNPLTGRPGNHGGMDLAYAGCTGAAILAPCAGRVAQGWDPTGGGNWTAVFGDDGCYWGMGHASAFAPNVNGRHVEGGATVAYVGTSGGSTGPHLHVSYKSPGATRYSDPYDMLAHAVMHNEQDWLTMATEDQVRAIVAQQVDSALRAMVPMLKEFRDYWMVTDARPEAGMASYVVSGLQKKWVPNNAYYGILDEAAKNGQMINNVGWKGGGTPEIALLDFCELIGGAPPPVQHS